MGYIVGVGPLGLVQLLPCLEPLAVVVAAGLPVRAALTLRELNGDVSGLAGVAGIYPPAVEVCTASSGGLYRQRCYTRL